MRKGSERFTYRREVFLRLKIQRDQTNLNKKNRIHLSILAVFQFRGVSGLKSNIDSNSQDAHNRSGGLSKPSG